MVTNPLAAQSPEPRRLVVMGDSLSAFHGIAEDQGWVALLQNNLQEHGINIINLSISGETTYGGVNRISQVLETHKPHYLVIELGSNDALRGLDLNEMESNLGLMIEAAQSTGTSVLILGMKIPPNYGKAYTDKFHATFAALAQRYDTALVPFFLEPVSLSYDYMQDDGYHPNAEAQPLILEHIAPTILEWLEIDLPASGDSQ